MKKISYKRLVFYEKRNRRCSKRKHRLTKRCKHNKLRRKIRNLTNPFYKLEQEIKVRRRAMVKKVYRKKSYSKQPIVVQIRNGFGIEERDNLDVFFEVACQFVDSSSKRITFDLSKCTQMWPSAVTLLCSLVHWVEMKAKPGKTPRLSSTISENDDVNGYLDNCGFYDYVGRDSDHSKVKYNLNEMVKIERETDKNKIKDRRDQVRALLKKYSSLSGDEYEKFVDHVLVEVTNNVSEHGLGIRNTLGWWVLAQYHRSHKFISVCIADNGIGFYNSLTSGPQYKYIQEKYANKINDEGEVIKLTFEESLSGAIRASIKQKNIIFKDKYKRGSRRGNGLKIIKDACKEIGIPLAILSHHGYIFIDKLGRYVSYGHKERLVFAGTLYHFLIPAKGD